jgi:membrane fusion protein (multidrug efflux system)
MFARVNIVYERRRDALQLPRTAILDADGQQSVYVVQAGKAQQRVIRTGLANGGWIEVLGGLKGDERVVTVGQAGLKSGTPVKVVDEATPKPAAALASDKPTPQA